MKRFIYLSFFALLFIGCQTFQPYKQESVVKFSYPELNKETTVQLGNSLIKQGRVIKGFAVIIKEDHFNMVPKGVYFVTGKKEFTNIDTNEKGFLYRFDNNGITSKIVQGRVHDTWLEYDTTRKTLKLRYGITVPYTIGEITKYELKEDAIKKVTNDNFQMELIYLGKSGNLLKFGYREFYNDYARPAFSNEISYDLNDSNIIGYKKAQLQVISATNTSITYKVLNYFDDDIGADLF